MSESKRLTQKQRRTALKRWETRKKQVDRISDQLEYMLDESEEPCEFCCEDCFQCEVKNVCAGERSAHSKVLRKMRKGISIINKASEDMETIIDAIEGAIEKHLQ